MAVNKTATKNTSDVKNTAPKKNGTKKRSDFPEAYVRFRTVLDGFELTAMRYFLENKDEAERMARAKELEKVMMPIIEEYQNRMMSDGGPGKCPPGYFDCGGCCLAYPCPN